MLPLRMLGLLMLMFLLCDAGSSCPSELNPLTLDPPEVIGKYGESVTVNCSSTFEDHDGMYWSQTGNKTVKSDFDVEDEKSFITGKISLSDWSVTAKCKIKLNASHECSKDLEITVYKNPEILLTPTSYANSVVEGTQYELQCQVHRVAPAQNLTVRWLKDNQNIKTESFANTTKIAINVSSTLKVNISREDNGAQFRCEAQLDFGPHGRQPPEISRIHTVSVHYAPELKNKSDIGLVTVDEGKDVTLNCEAEGNPPPEFHWKRKGINLTAKINSLRITRARISTTYICTATNALGNITKEFNIHVIKTTTTTAPEASTPRGCPLLLSPTELVVRYGDPALVHCSTTATNVLGMGWEAAEAGVGFQNVLSVNWTVEELKEWTIEPQCYVTLRDMYQCHVIPAVTLYKTPDKVSLSGHHGPMEEGTEYKLMCDIIDVAPVQKLKVKWYRGNELVLTKEFNDTSVVPLNVSSTLKVIPERDYNAAVFRCEAELHLGPKGPELVPNVTSPPYVADVLYKPRIQGCPDRHAGVENEFSMDMLPCQGDGNPPTTVQWFYQGEPVNASEPLTRTQSGKYIAQVGNRLGRSNTSVDITIEYSPSFTCNDRYEVEEDGKLQTCEPKGKPSPTITWFKDGKKIASPQRWTKHDSGKYVLTASNKHGTVNHMLNLDVLYAPVFSEGSYMKEVAPGENVTFDCLAEGNPPPLIRWNNTAAVNVRVTAGGRQTSISVTGATSTNAGVYICVASNRVGNVTKSVILKMRGKTTAGPSPLIWGLLILLVVILLLLVAFILHSHKKKHGQYSFEPVNANDGSDIPMSTQSNGVRV